MEKIMKVLTRLGTLAAVMALAFLFNPDALRAQNDRGCAWPIELSPEGFGNMTGPDTFARYWVVPFDHYDTMTIQGTYPNARYFSFVAYNTKDDGTSTGKMPRNVTTSLYDAQIVPDSGSNNPFVKPRGGNGTYTVVISRAGQTSGNTIGLPSGGLSSGFAWVLLRVYEPDADPSVSGQSLMGGVPLPTISVTGNGPSQQLQPCSPVNKLNDVRGFLQSFFPPEFDILGHEGTPSSGRLWFAPPKVTPIVLMPNPDNKYVVAFPGDQYEPGRIIVIRGKSPSFPETFEGSRHWVASRGVRNAHVRYWSLCIDNLALPVTVVGCKVDLTTDVEDDYYTVVISDDLQRPDWLRLNINWLPWGDEQYPKVVFLRNMLPSSNFPYSIQKAIDPGSCTFDFDFPTLPDRDPVDTAGQCAQGVMGDYYPVAAWCDKATFISRGVRACLDERDRDRKWEQPWR
jgi:hypothetical protein